MSSLARPVQRSLRTLNNCSRCSQRVLRQSVHLPTSPTRQYSTGGPSRPSNQRAFSLPLAVLLVLPAAYYFYPTERANRRLSPQTYSEQQVVATASLSPTHKLVRVAVAPRDRALFGAAAVRQDGTPATADGEVVVQHVMIKSPDLQIERPYTPINDAEADGSMDMIVKRVRGGEVGRLIHSLKEGQDVGIRGPITTFSINPRDYDRIVMISSGTGVAPMLQLLSKLPDQSPDISGPQLDLVHALPQPGRPDWLAQAGILTTLQDKLGGQLRVSRIQPGAIDRNALKTVLGGLQPSERLMVLVCLPPNLMKPFCGPLTMTLQQGELTGTLRDLGLGPHQVYKLE